MRRARSIILVSAVALAAGLSAPTPASSAFPGTNGKIAFTTTRGGNFEVYVMNADGTGQANLSNNAAFDFAPAWSPDGTKIAFETFRDGNFEVY